jgi:hypothetical protein
VRRPAPSAPWPGGFGGCALWPISPPYSRPGRQSARLQKERLKTVSGHETREKLYAATRTLAAGTGPLKARLRASLTKDLVALQPEDFPWPDLGERWSGVISELAPNQRPIITLEQWWDFELIRVAQEIVDIYDQITRRLAAA